MRKFRSRIQRVRGRKGSASKIKMNKILAVGLIILAISLIIGSAYGWVLMAKDMEKNITEKRYSSDLKYCLPCADGLEENQTICELHNC